jgi:2,3-bisphosphoglycerate-dependent phosphoglycerate mutase
MTELLIIRHGETDWNRERRLQGHIDIELNALGLEQADRLGRALAQESLDVLISSDLKRARQTAEAIARYQKITVQPDRHWRERAYGDCEGLTYDDWARVNPVEYAAWKNRELDLIPQGGESLRQFFQRIEAVAHTTAQQYSGQRIAVVVHGGVLDILYRAAVGQDMKAPRRHDLLNASINRLKWAAGQFSLLSWADVRHLETNVLDEL